MKSQDVLKNVEIIYKSENYRDDMEIGHLTESSNDIRDNSCFILIKGHKFDSHELVNTLTVKPALIVAQRQINTEIPYIIVNDTLKTVPLICYNFYDNPSEKLKLIGVTGTDGKTTTAIVIRQIIDHFESCAYAGTNGFMAGEKLLSNGLTTPKAIVLNRFLHDLAKNNIRYASLEVSSQGLDSHRVDYLKFKIGIFTNLTHEHLDHHKTIENYFQSKLKLFKMLDSDGFAIVNSDSEPYASRIIENTPAKSITYGQAENSDFRISDIRIGEGYSMFDLFTPSGILKNIRTNLFGDYNVYNVTAALCAANALGFRLEECIPVLGNLKEIDGRMHIVDCGQPFKVIVDFAHTPNGLDCLLRNLSRFRTNHLTVVFGSAGERDKTKRPVMGSVVEKYASEIILTNEDPKSEDGFDIILDIFKGIKNPNIVKIIPNRREAIAKALENARNNDIVVITGKGNEKFQLFNGFIIDHNDIDVAETYLSKKYQQQYINSIANM